MDPPSFTRKILQEELNISDADLSKYQKILSEKAAVIQRKLAVGDDDSEEGESRPGGEIIENEDDDEEESKD